jgi:hypothetical protein
MTIDEALKILESMGLKPKETTWGEYLKAVALGIEALKRVKWNRENYAMYRISALPGETEE